ncbi:peptidylprolyl isomerase [Candidatus Kaiserbacteria bacterium]|nr:MAG: peptidylprolyl isomerase [Candidatus Kaiserbacteria bacterium]
MNQNESIAVVVGVVVSLLFVPALFIISGGDKNTDTKVKIHEVTEKIKRIHVTQSSTAVHSNFTVKDFVKGEGEKAQYGDTLYVHYVGQLLNGETFDTSAKSDVPFEVQLGVGQVITGWELGLVGMKEGGTRRLIIPAEFAYGEREIANQKGEVIIPANSTLLFDIILLKIKRALN